MSEVENIQEALLKVLQKAEQAQFDEALTLFEAYLETLFSSNFRNVMNWPFDWKSRHILLFKAFREKPGKSHELLRLLDKKKKADRETLELYDYLRVCLIFHANETSSLSPEELKTFVRKYPSHPDFHFYYGLFLSRANDYTRAIDELKYCMRLSQHAEYYLPDLLHVETQYFEQLILEKDFYSAEQFIFSMQSYYQSYFHQPEWAWLHRQLILSKVRVQDHKMLSKQFDKVGEIVAQKTEKERRRLVEVLGVFAAFLAFVFANVEIMTHYPLKEAFYLLLTMADILLIFVLVISFVFNRPTKKKLWESTRFRFFGILLFSLCLIAANLPSREKKTTNSKSSVQKYYKKS